MNLFENFGLSQETIQSIKDMGIEKPTQIQSKTIPEIMNGKDVIGESATGSGKTLAFGCGIVENLIPGKGLQALVLTPTRELAEQVREALQEISSKKRFKIISVYGGVAIDPQIHQLTKADVVVATPGRFLDHLHRGTVDTSKIKLLILDEADRMFDMGFIDDVETIIQQCPKYRQTLFFSATMSNYIYNFAKKYMKDPVNAAVQNQVDPSKLKQVYYNIQKNMKLSLLLHLLQNEKSGLVMVFCNSRRTTDFVVKNLQKNQMDAIAIHGGLSQNKRTRTIQSFNKGKVSVLVCTDVAARGLHIENVSHVYNYEIPKDATDYVHRIGRTARAGKDGKVINILSEIDHDSFSRVLETYRNFNVEELETPKVKKVFAVRQDSFRRGSFRGHRKKSFHGHRRGARA